MTMMHDHDNTVAPTTAATEDHRDAWQVIEEVCHQRLSGELTLITPAPTATRVYMNNGLVYFAEHDGDDTLASRLVVAGALDDEQLRRGAIRLNGVEHLGRLFERDDTVDRDAVELAIELITEMTLSDVADQPVRSFRTTMYRHHASGINRWFSSQHTMEDEATVTGAVPVVAAVAPQQPVAVAPLVPLAPLAVEPEVAPIVAALEAVTPLWATAAAVEPVAEISEPVVEPVVEVAEPVVEPIVDVAPEPFVDVAREPFVEVVPEAIVEVVPEPVAAFVPEPVVPFEPAPIVEVAPEPIIEPAPTTEPTSFELLEVAVATAAPAPEAYHPSLDLSDLVAAMGVGTTRSLDPADDDRPVVTPRMWAPSATPPEPAAPPPAVPEPFQRQADPDLDALIASLVQTAPVAPVRAEPPSPTIASVQPADLSAVDHGDVADDDGVEWFAMPAMPATAPRSEPDLVQYVEPEPIAIVEPEPIAIVEPVVQAVVEAVIDPIAEAAPEPVAEAAPEPTVEAVFVPVVEPAPEPVVPVASPVNPVLPTLAAFTRVVPPRDEDAPEPERAVIGAPSPLFALDPNGPRLPGMVIPQQESPIEPEPVHTIETTPIASLGTLSALTPIAPLEVSITPAPMVPVAPTEPTPLATVHPIRDTTTPGMATVESVLASITPPAPIHAVPELGTVPVPEDVAAAVRRAISAIEAATVSTGPAPVTFGPLHVTSYAQQPVSREAAAFHATAAVPAPATIQPVQGLDRQVTPLLSLNATAAPATPTVAAQPAGLTPMHTGGIPLTAAEMPFPEIEFPPLPPAEELLSNPQAAPISTQRRGALRRLIDGIRRR